MPDHMTHKAAWPLHVQVVDPSTRQTRSQVGRHLLALRLWRLAGEEDGALFVERDGGVGVAGVWLGWSSGLV